MASITQDGTAETPVFPWSLRFVPNADLDFPATVEAGYTDFRDDLKTITKGTKLYDVYATDVPTELGGTEQKIAQIVTSSEMTTSYWGDEHFYIRHERMDDDLAIHPEWKPYTPEYKGIFSLAEDDSEASGCPFAEILNFLQ